MAKKVLKKGTLECDFHNDLYALHQNYGGVESNPEYWNSVVDEITKIAKKYHKTDMQKFVECTLIAFADYLNTKAVGNSDYNARMIAEIICCGRPRTEVEKIAKEMGVMK